MGAWVHPRDLALHAVHLIGTGEPAITGRKWIRPPVCWPRGMSRPRSLGASICRGSLPRPTLRRARRRRPRVITAITYVPQR
jgi:hypothetical protein